MPLHLLEPNDAMTKLGFIYGEYYISQLSDSRLSVFLRAGTTTVGPYKVFKDYDEIKANFTVLSSGNPQLNPLTPLSK